MSIDAGNTLTIKNMKMKNQLVVAALSAAVAFTSVEAGLSKAQTAAIGKSFASIPKAEYAAKAAELVSQAAAVDKQDTALAAVKGAMAKAPATAPVVVGAIAQLTPEFAPAVAAAAAKLSPAQADTIAKAAAQAAPAQAEKIMLAVIESAPKSTRSIAEAVVNSVPSVVSNSKVFRVRGGQSIADGPPGLVTSGSRIASWQLINGQYVFVLDIPFQPGAPNNAGGQTQGGDPLRPYGSP